MTLLLTISACGGSNYIRPDYGSIQPAVSDTPFEVFLAGDTQPLQSLQDIYPQDVIRLEARGVPKGVAVAWLSADITVAGFQGPGELLIRREGQTELRIQAAGNRIIIPIRVVSAKFPYNESIPPPPDNKPQDPEPEPTEDPIPDPVPSDPFMDEVHNFDPGPNAGFGSSGFPDIVLGGPQGKGPNQGGFHVLSLGVGGSIILKSETPILNGPGEDFIVFENVFNIGGNPETPFVELAEVSVSQDGINFLSFACEQDNADEFFPGCAGVSPVLANVLTNTLEPTDPEEAGGDAFDLESLNLYWIKYVKIQDLSNTGGGNSAGFDLDAIAIVHQ